MPSVTIIKFEGSEEEISRFLAQNGHAATPPLAVGGGHAAQPKNGGIWDHVAAKFERYIRATAAGGRPGQKNAMLAWLKGSGDIELTKLWKSAGVKAQHDYAGVGGSLTKNMAKAGGPKDWYTTQVDAKGEWHYTILPELVEPLRRAFGV